VPLPRSQVKQRIRQPGRRRTVAHRADRQSPRL